VRYLINQREPLLAHVSIPAIPIHNNDTERDLRHVVTSRKNWQVFGSPRGGQVGARLFSLVLSAKLAGVNVQEYLEDVLGRVSTVKSKDVAELTPWGWAAERERLGQAG
jgi:transposase